MSTSVWERAGIRGYAQAVTGDEDLAKVKAWPTTQIREAASNQLKLSKDALEKASSVAWYEGLYVRWLNHQRWGPFVKQIEDSEQSLKTGDEATDEQKKRDDYIASWAVARLAASGISKEANLGETTYIFAAKDIGNKIADTAKPLINSASAIADNVATAVKLGIGLGIILLIYKETKK